jgi:hypothetical protein
MDKTLLAVRKKPTLTAGTAKDELLRTVGGPDPSAFDRLIYVTGSARGGTTLTSRIISLQPRVVTWVSPSHFLNHVWRYRKRIHSRLWEHLLWKPKYLRRSIVRDSLPEERRRAYLKLINRAVLEKDLHDLYRLYPLTKALDPEETRDPASFLAWLDKGNDFWGVDQLPKAFPKGRFVFVVRDPRGTIASLAKRMARRRADTEFTLRPSDVIESAIYWRNLVRQQLRFAKRHPGQTILFRFEDLIARPVAMAQSLYAALDLPAIPETELKQRLGSLKYSTSNDPSEISTGVKRTPNERWRKNLDVLALDLISGICGPSARLLGYDLPAPTKKRSALGIAALVPDRKKRLKVLAKLAFLAVMDTCTRSYRVARAVPLLAAS